MKVKKCTNFIEKRGIIQNYKIMYLKNQKILGETVLLGGIYYEIKNDSINNNFFVVNQNNQIIYLSDLTGRFYIKESELCYYN